MYNSQRSIDEQQERIINQYLIKYFYKPTYAIVEDICDKSRQQKGIDIIADDLIIDNKAQSSKRFLNNPTNTFILEISTFNRLGNEMAGWFVNNELLTNYYAFIWIPKAKVNNAGYLTSYKDIEQIEIMIVDRKALHAAINEIWSDIKLHNFAENLRKQGISRSDPAAFKHIGHFTCSTQLREMPVNLVVKKDFYKQFAIKHCYVTPQAIIDIK